MVVRMNGLVKRRGIWQYRRMVPLRLRSIIGSREVKRSLGTADLEAAQRRWQTEKTAVDRLFAEAEAALKHPSQAAYRAVEEWRQDRATRPVDDDAEEALDHHLTDLLELGEPRTDDSGEVFPPPPGEKPLAPHQRIIVEALLKRRESEDADNPPLSILFDRWRAERQPPQKTWEEWATARKRFEQVIGGDIPVRRITKDHVRAFKQRLLKTPARRRGTDAEGRPAMLSPASIQKQLNAVKSVLSWAVREGYLNANPADGITHARANGAVHGEDKRRLPWDADDLRKLFSVKRDDGADHWLPLLALWTGARLEELGQLRVNDMRTEHGTGVPFIDIRPGDGRRVKTRGSERKVPIHAELVRLGFLDYVERQRKNGQTRLFPELRADRHGTLTRLWGKRFRYFARSVGLSDPRKTFHSFRHGFVDACREVMSEEHRHALTGHSGGGVGRRYGTSVPLRILAESLARVQYPGLQ